MFQVFSEILCFLDNNNQAELKTKKLRTNKLENLILYKKIILYKKVKYRRLGRVDKTAAFAAEDQRFESSVK